MYFQMEVEPYTSLGELESRDPTDETIVSHMQISQFLLGPELSESVYLLSQRRKSGKRIHQRICLLALVLRYPSFPQSRRPCASRNLEYT
jgi:hypothetical protein